MKHSWGSPTQLPRYLDSSSYKYNSYTSFGKQREPQKWQRLVAALGLGLKQHLQRGISECEVTWLEHRCSIPERYVLNKFLWFLVGISSNKNSKCNLPLQDTRGFHLLDLGPAQLTVRNDFFPTKILLHIFSEHHLSDQNSPKPWYLGRKLSVGIYLICPSHGKWGKGIRRTGWRGCGATGSIYNYRKRY